MTTARDKSKTVIDALGEDDYLIEFIAEAVCVTRSGKRVDINAASWPSVRDAIELMIQSNTN